MAYEALQDVAPAYLVHYVSAILASFHFHTIPDFSHLKALGFEELLGFPSAWNAHTSMWQASYYLGFH